MSLLGPHRIEFDIIHHLSIPQDLATVIDHHVALFPTRYVPYVPGALPAQSAGRPPRGRRVRAPRTHGASQVAVLEVSGPLSAVVVENLDHAVELALSDGPRGVVCDLSAVSEGVTPSIVQVLATAGRHVRDWPGTPVGVVCADPEVRTALLAHPLGRHLIVAESVFSALSAVLAIPAVATERLRLASTPTAPRAARELVARSLRNWRLEPCIPFASLVVSELVASSMTNAGTDIDVCVARSSGALRLTVRDRGPAPSDQRPVGPDLRGRELTVVAGLSRAFGTLPAANGGKVAWAVLEISQPRPSTSNAARFPA